MFSYLLCINICLCLCLYFVDGFIIVHNVRRSVVKELHVSNGGQWGDWGPPQFCAAGTYAVGYNMKIEPQGGDDTSLNGIRLECEAVNGTFGGEVTSTVGPWGNWESGPIKCDRGNVFKMFSLQVEVPGGDDTAANFVKFMCQNLAGTSQTHEIVRDPGHGFWGTFGGYSESCDEGSAICGLKTKVEQDQGSLSDDTALNDAVMYCCND